MQNYSCPDSIRGSHIPSVLEHGIDDTECEDQDQGHRTDDVHHELGGSDFPGILWYRGAWSVGDTVSEVLETFFLRELGVQFLFFLDDSCPCIGWLECRCTLLGTVTDE